MSDVVNFERGLGFHVHDFATEFEAMYLEVSPGRCALCAYWPEEPPRATVISVDRDAGTITARTKASSSAPPAAPPGE